MLSFIYFFLLWGTFGLKVKSRLIEQINFMVDIPISALTPKDALIHSFCSEYVAT